MKLETKAVEKVWGRTALPPPFQATGSEPVGEIWFEPPPQLSDVLVKYLFTSEALSVQVHPRDAEAPAGSRGKEECWLVLDAEPGAALAIGFREALSKEAVRAAAEDGSIEELLEWHPVAAGDFFYLPAGTVHAIGAGLTIVEVQQNSDITYRLYDYGRPRELHLDAGIAVADTGPYAEKWHRRVDSAANDIFVEGPFFRFSQCVGAPSPAIGELHRGPVMALPLGGSVTIAGEHVASGESGLAETLAAIDFSAARRTLLVSSASPSGA